MLSYNRLNKCNGIYRNEAGELKRRVIYTYESVAALYDLVKYDDIEGLYHFKNMRPLEIVPISDVKYYQFIKDYYHLN